MATRKIIVTGGAGYIGSHTVVELVNAGFTPIIVDDLRNSHASALEGIGNIIGQVPAFRQVDVNDEQALEEVFAKEGPIEGVIHFAADKSVNESVAEPLKYYRNNVGNLVSLLSVMHGHAVKRLVFSSSCTVYGQPDDLPVTERSPDRNAASPYGMTKVICEQMLRDVFASDPTMHITMLRYFNPIGAHPSAHIGELPLGVPNNLVPFVTQTAAGIRKELVIFGDDYDTPDGTCVRDYIHVVDLAKAHVRALDRLEKQAEPKCESFNLGTGNGNTVLEVVNVFKEVNKVDLPYKIGPRRPGDVEKIWADTSHSQKVLDWKTELTLGDALRDAWRWESSLRKKV